MGSMNPVSSAKIDERDGCIVMTTSQFASFKRHVLRRERDREKKREREKLQENKNNLASDASFRANNISNMVRSLLLNTCLASGRLQI